ncbi:opsin-3-like [Pelodytes ibericus]
MSHTNISDNGHIKKFFTDETYDLLALTVSSLGILGSSTNLLALVLYYKFQQLRTPTNLLLVNICLSDFLFSVFGASFTFMACVRRQWIWDDTTCEFDGFTKLLFGLVSVFTVTVLASERYIHVVNENVIDFSWSWRAITCIWIYSLVWASAPLIGWNRYTIEVHGLGCSLNLIPSTPYENSFVLVFFFVCVIIPLDIVLYCYGTILYEIQKLRRGLHLQNSQVSKIRDYEIKMATMFCLMILAFLFCWMPHLLSWLLATFGYGSLITPTNSIILSFFARSNIFSNPVIYIFMTKKFRQGAQILFLRCFGFQGTLDGKPINRCVFTSYFLSRVRIGSDTCVPPRKQEESIYNAKSRLHTVAKSNDPLQHRRHRREEREDLISRGRLIIGGDLNAIADYDLDRRATGVCRNELRMRRKSEKFSECLFQHNLYDVWRVQHPEERDFTFFSGVHSTYTRIDYFLMPGTILQGCVSTRLGHIEWSDHAPVIIELRDNLT